MSQFEKLTIGRIGENFARKYLENKGFKIIAQNYRTKYGEIDLIGECKNELVFIEVRTKTKDKFGDPEETFNFKKINKIKKNALVYVSKVNWDGPIRFDALCLVLDKRNQPIRIDHYENIC